MLTNQTRPMHNHPMSQSFCQSSNTTFQPRFNSSFPTGPVNLPSPVQRPQRFFMNSQVFRQPQADKNVFKPNSIPYSMSTSTRLSFNFNIIRHLISNQNWIAEELFNTNTPIDEPYETLRIILNITTQDSVISFISYYT
nr:unnamed protein product [Callosobruchus analis]